MSLPRLPLVGQSLGDYRVEAYLDGGQFGDVYRATHEPSGTAVALKVLDPNASVEQIREFDNEAELLVKLSGATAVVNLLDTQSAPYTLIPPGPGIPFHLTLRFHVLELAQDNLATVVALRAAVPWSDRLALFRGVVLGAHQMHLKNIAHRDLKSSNCLLYQRRFNVLEAKVADLGRSRDLTQPSLASAHLYAMPRGDPAFAPPELIWGLGTDTPEQHLRSDLYLLGSILFELATGQGITAMVLLPRLSIFFSDLAMPPPIRAARFSGRLLEIRSWYESEYSLLYSELPPCLRHPTVELLRQLCDPDPVRRLPRVARGRRASVPPGLLWLIARVDILRKLLYKSEIEAAHLASRKVAR